MVGTPAGWSAARGAPASAARLVCGPVVLLAVGAAVRGANAIATLVDRRVAAARARALELDRARGVGSLCSRASHAVVGLDRARGVGTRSARAFACASCGAALLACVARRGAALEVAEAVVDARLQEASQAAGGNEISSLGPHAARDAQARGLDLELAIVRTAARLATRRLCVDAHRERRGPALLEAAARAGEHAHRVVLAQVLDQLPAFREPVLRRALLARGGGGLKDVVELGRDGLLLVREQAEPGVAGAASRQT